MAHPMARRLRITGMHRRAPASIPICRITQSLRGGRTVEVPAHAVATTVSGWLAELGVVSPLVDELATAIRIGDWSAARAIGEYLSVDVTVAP